VPRGKVAILVALLLGAAGGSSAAQPVPPPAEQISADCGAAIYATDQLVCSDTTLRALDAEMLRLWTRAEAKGRVTEAGRSAQREWFRQRSLCAFEADHRACALAAYRARIATLRARFDAPLTTAPLARSRTVQHESDLPGPGMLRPGGVQPGTEGKHDVTACQHSPVVHLQTS
jgi:uncharacterized protein